MTQSYDNNGNVETKTTPARNQSTCTPTVTTTFSYDALNRLIGKTYSDSTAAVSYFYDQTNYNGLTITNGKGRRTGMSDSSGATAWSYDSAGRVLIERRTIAGITKTISYSYNLDGSAATVTYPGGRQVTYTVSNAQRLTSAKDLVSGTQFAITASYAPPGGLQSVITGKINGGFGGITETHSYNNRLQYTSTQATSSAGTALNLSLGYNLPGGNNGSVASITNNVTVGRTQTFTYDALNRVLSAQSSATSGTDCWGQNFGLNGQAAADAFGNLTAINSGTQPPQACPFGNLDVTINANNRFTGIGYAYDAAGNMNQDGSGYTYTFDAENRIVQASGMTGGPYCYVYDGNGLRVAKKSNAPTCSQGTITTIYWRSIAGDAIAETDASGSTTNAAYNEYIFFAGRRIARRTGPGSVYYYFADHLGTPRTITDAQGNVCYDADFTPYGQEMQKANTCPQNYRFTGYEWDSETELYYAFARYYSPRIGRFLSTDRLGGDIASPQSLNRYGYVLGDPLNSIDPTGDDHISGGSQGLYGHACASYLAAGASPALACYVGGYYGGYGWGGGGFGGGGFGFGFDAIPPPIVWTEQRPPWALPLPPWITSSGFDWLTLIFGPPDPNLLIFREEPAQPFCSVLDPSCKPESKPSCPAVYFKSVHKTLGKSPPPPPGLGPGDAARRAAEAAANRHIINRGLSVPLRSSIVRGILGLGRAASGAILLAPVLYAGAVGLKEEWNAWKSGECTTIWTDLGLK